MKKQDLWFIAFMIVAGIILRVMLPADMEYKDDERLMFKMAHENAASGIFPDVGMMSGGGVVNPGLSAAVFAWIAKFTSTPLQMAQAVQWINVLTLLLFVLFIYIKIPADERIIWLFGISLAAVSPLAVLFSRKIWAQDLLPIFTFFLIVTNSYRSKIPGAFLYGCAAMLIGQLHMSGFFLAAGIVIFSFLYDRHHHHKMRWLPFIAGAAIGIVPMIPWIKYITAHDNNSYLTLDHVLQFRFYIYTFMDAHGINLKYSLGDEFSAFMQEPKIGSSKLYLVGLMHFVLGMAVLFTVYKLGKYLYERVSSPGGSFSKYIYRCKSIRFYLQGIFLGLGILMTFSGTEIYPHYLICMFPFTYLFLAKVYENNTKIFKVIVAAQLVVTLLFMNYIHQHNGVKRGDYGPTYQSQIVNE